MKSTHIFGVSFFLKKDEDKNGKAPNIRKNYRGWYVLQIFQLSNR